MTNDLWSVGSNWTGGSPLGDARATLVFPATAANLTITNDLANLTIQTIRFTGNKAYTIGGNALTLHGSIALESGVTTATDRILLDITLAANQTWRVTAAGATLDVEGVVSGKHRLSKSDAGTLVLGGANLYNGTTVNAGTLTVASGQSLGSGTLTLHGGKIQSSMPVMLANPFAVSASSSVVGNNDIAFTGAGSLAKGVTLTITNAGTTTFAGKLSGVGTLVEAAGIGTLVLAANNGHDASTLHSGTLLVLADSALGTGTFTLDGGTLAAGVTVNLANNYSVTGSATIGGTKDLTLRGSGTLTAGTTLTVTNSGTTTFLGTVSGSGNLTEAAALGTLVLPGRNAYTGMTTLSSGTLMVGDNGALGTGVLDLDGGTLQASNGLTFTNVFTVTNTSMVSSTSDLTFVGPGTLSAGAVLSVNNAAGTVTFLGNLSGEGGLSMLGTSVLVLAGNNTFTGDTTVAAGTLLVNGTPASSDVTVSSGATLSGAGTLGSITAAGAISPGGAGPGQLQSDNAVFNAGSSLVIRLNGTNAGIDYDQLAANGTVDLSGGPLLDATAGFSSNGGDTFTIIASTGGITGMFAGLPDGTTFSTDGVTLQIHYAANAVTLTNVASPLPPPPGALVNGWKTEPLATNGMLEPMSGRGLFSMALGHEGSSQFAQEEQPAGQSRHERTGNPGRRLMVEGHAQGEPLPLHAAIERSIGAADDPLGRQE